MDNYEELNKETCFEGGETDLKQVIAFALDYCQTHGIHITTDEVFQKWQEEVEEGGI